jgi:hypothetical protein
MSEPPRDAEARRAVAPVICYPTDALPPARPVALRGGAGGGDRDRNACGTAA